SVPSRLAALEIVGHRLRLPDLGSPNGPFAGALCVTDVFLDGDPTIRLGSTVLHIVPRTAAAVDLPSASGFGHVVGASTEMRRLYRLCQRLAESPVPVVIEGETGTGKEVLAESLHAMGPRASG